MKKLLSALLAFALVFSCAAGISAQSGEDYEDYEDTGIEMDYPDAGITVYVPYELLAGIDLNSGSIETIFSTEMGYRAGVFLTQIAYVPDDEDLSLYVPYLTFVCLRDNYKEEITESSDFKDFVSEDAMMLVAEGEGYTHYVVIGCDAYPEGLTEDEIQTYEKLLDVADDIVYGARYYEPEDPSARLKGRKADFQTMDLEGNPVDSAELFAQNKITMLNLWATFCGPCKEELPDLAKIHERLQEIGCGIVGIVYDTVDQAHVDTARQLSEDAGVTYPMVQSPSNIGEVFDLGAFPISCFVDHEGNVVGAPVLGNAVDEYEAAVKDLLADQEEASSEDGAEMPAKSGKTAEKGFAGKLSSAAKVKTAGKNAPGQGEPAYRILCKDEEGNPVAGVFVQFCSDTMCQFGPTDDSGVAAFDSAPGHYTIHLVEVPDGYAPDETEYEAPETGGEVEITVKKAA